MRAPQVTIQNDLVEKENAISLLLIDDNPLVLETIKQLLKKTHYELLLADDPFNALCSLVENKPSVVFIDAAMSKLHGYQFCALVKAQAKYQYIPLVVVLEYANKVEQAKALAAGADAVLVKPFGENELLNIVNANGGK